MSMQLVSVLAISGVIGAGGCAQMMPVRTPEPVAIAPLAANGAKAPASDARTVEEFDTTSTAERVAAAAPPTGGTRLGVTYASLGDPTDPGFWLKTPLVSRETEGRVETTGGKSVRLMLLPLEAAIGAGSHISLPAMRVLGLPLTDLPELIVYRN